MTQCRPEIQTYHLSGDERMRYMLSHDRGFKQKLIAYLVLPKQKAQRGHISQPLQGAAQSLQVWKNKLLGIVPFVATPLKGRFFVF